MRPVPSVSYDEVAKELPLLVATKPAWAELAAANLPVFLADHAVCEQQVALYALSLAGWYPDDFELVEAAANLAAEEIQHFRRVVAILNRRQLPTGLLEVLQESDPEVARLLADLGPAEKRHWQLFFRLAGREVAAEALAERFRGWLELDRDLALAAGIPPTVHG